MNKTRSPFNKRSDAMLAQELKRHLDGLLHPRPDEIEAHYEYCRLIAYTIMWNRPNFNQDEFLQACGCKMDFNGNVLTA